MLPRGHILHPPPARHALARERLRTRLSGAFTLASWESARRIQQHRAAHGPPSTPKGRRRSSRATPPIHPIKAGRRARWPQARRTLARLDQARRGLRSVFEASGLQQQILRVLYDRFRSAASAVNRHEDGEIYIRDGHDVRKPSAVATVVL